MNISASERVFCIRSSVPTKAALYWLISGMCKGSMFHMIHNLKLEFTLIYLNVVQVTDEFYSYTLLEVLNTVCLIPGCSAIIQYKVSMSMSIHCFSLAMMSPIGWRCPKVTKVFPVKRSSISSCTNNLNSPSCIDHISSPII